MKVLLLVFNRTGQGTYWRAYHLGRHLARRGHAVTLLSTSPSRRLGFTVTEQDGLSLVQSPDLLSGPLRSGWDPWNTLRRIAWLRGRRFDIVHAFESRPTVIYPALAAAKSGAALVMDWCDWFGRGGSVEERPSALQRLLLRPVETYFEEHFRLRAAAATVICTPLRDRALALGVPPESVLLLPNGSDTGRLSPLPIAGARRQVGLPEQAFILGYVGAIFRGDAALMAQAFDILYGQIPHLRLLIAGYCPFDVRSLSAHPEAVIQTGPLDESRLNAYLAASDLFWLPLRDTLANRGRFPLKLTDYMAVGRPVVATAVGDVAPLLEQEPAGLLSPPEPEAFARQTLRLHRDPALRAQMGARARLLAETRFSWERLAAGLEAHYTRALAAARHPQPSPGTSLEA